MAWSTLPSVSPGDTISSSSWGNIVKANLEYLLNRPSFYVLRDNGSSYTTTSTSFANIDNTNLTGTMTMVGTKAKIGFVAAGQLSNTGYMMFDISVDGVRFAAGGTDGIYSLNFGAGPTTAGGIAFEIMVSGLSAGSHTFKPMYRVNTGAITGTVYSGSGSGGSDALINFYGYEVA